jgi:hypothetical protein
VSGRRRFGFCFAAALVGLSPTRPARAAAGVSCRAERAGQRALVQIHVTELFDRELLHLVELGLVGRLHIEATLYRRRRFWFDPRLVESSHLFSIAWSKDDKRFTLEGQTIASPYAFGLPLLALRPDGVDDDGLTDRDPGGGAYVEILLRLEVITPTSLGQVARWLVTNPAPATEAEPGSSVASAAPAAPRTVVPRALLNFLANDLARTARGSCPVER